MLGQRDTFGINGSFGATETKFSINFTKANTKVCLSLHYNTNNSYLYVNAKEIFPLTFQLSSVSEGNLLINLTYWTFTSI